MESYDPAKAAQIWERIHGGSESPPPGSDLLPLISQALSVSDAYLRLSRHFTGKDTAMLKKLHEQAQSHAACLKGICFLTTGEKPAVKAPAFTGESPDGLLRRCYGQEMRALAEYERRSGDPEYGPVFAQLAEQAQSHCRTVLELLGKYK